MPLEGYDLEEVLHDSPRSLVRRARDTATDTSVVIKTLKSFEAADQDRLRHEYEMAKDLNLPGCVRALAFREEGGQAHLILEDFRGESLSAWAARTSPDLMASLRVAARIAEALAEVHGRELIHLDLKPANILIAPEEHRIKITDFGLAVSGRRLAGGSLEGTLHYMSPEQTGRMNRSVDHRSDLYSLGVILYELVAGRRPFIADDALALVHAHMAQMPPALADIAPNVPEVVQRIASRLLEKSADARYQSAAGVLHDLNRCVEHLERSGRVPAFELGERDVAPHFRLPEGLYGRAAETEELRQALQRAARGGRQLVLVSGGSGVGKSALVRELAFSVSELGGHFITGKFDQLSHNAPYSAWLTAFSDFSDQLLLESDTELEAWKQRIRTAVGANVSLLTAVIPGLSMVLGATDQLEELPPAEAQNRFNYTLRKLVEAIASPEHPLVVALDDLQWADAASLQLMETLLTDATDSALLVVGTLRDSEVGDNHPLWPVVSSVEQVAGATTRVALTNLSFPEVGSYVADALGSETDELSQLVHELSEGNPLFMVQLLESLVAGGQLEYSPSEQRWRFDIAAIRALEPSDDFVDLFLAKVAALPESTREVLAIAACIGQSFDIATLRVIPRSDPIEARAALAAAERCGVVTRSRAGTYDFAHDRLQQAAAESAKLTGARLAQVHLTIGRRLLAQASSRDARIFDLAGHFLEAAAVLTDDHERVVVSEVMVRAASRAKQGGAFEAAAHYVETGLQLLPEQAWVAHYPLWLELELAEVELASILSRQERVQAGLRVLDERVEGRLDRVRVGLCKLRHLANLGRYEDGIHAAVAALAEFGVEVPTDPEHVGEALEAEVARIGELLGERPPTVMLDLPPCQDPEMLATLELLSDVFDHLYITGQMELMGWLGCRLTSLTLEHGPSAYAAFGPGIQAVGLAAMQQYEEADQLGQLAVALADRFGSARVRGRMRFVYGAFVQVFAHPIEESLEMLDRAFVLTKESGDLAYAAYSAIFRATHGLRSGAPVAEVEECAEDFRQFIGDRAELRQLGFATEVELPLAGLLGRTHERGGVDHSYFSMEEFANEASDHPLALASLTYARLHNLVLFGRFAEAAALYDEVICMEEAVSGQIIMECAQFWVALSVLASRGPREHSERMRQQLVPLAEAAAENYAHRVLLVDAERAWVEGDAPRAADLYDEAIEEARASGLLQDEALANERAAAFWLSRARREVAGSYLTRAHTAYRRWGAQEKVASLEDEHPALLGGSTEPSHALTESSTGRSGAERLDLAAILKASQALSQEIVLDRLLERMMRIVVETSGAERAAFIEFAEGVPRIRALWSQARSISQPDLPLSSSDFVAPAVANYVARTGSAVTIDDAGGDSRFRTDAILRARGPASVLCVPIHSKGKVAALIYFENTLTTNAFTSERTAVIEMLSSQIAISIENAHLVENLEERVQERTEELSSALARLESAQAHLVHTEKMAAVAAVVAGVAHEVNTPIGALQSSMHTSARCAERIEEELGAAETLSALRQSRSLQRALETQKATPVTAENAVKRVQTIVQRLLDFTHLDRGELEPFDIHRGIESALALLTPDIGSSSIARDYGDLKPLLCAPAQINQVFMALLRFTTKRLKGGGELEIETSEAAGRVHIRFSDNGPRVPEDRLDKLFEVSFDRAGSRVKMDLELPNASNIVQEHHGEITVESTDSRTSFEVTLPMSA